MATIRDFFLVANFVSVTAAGLAPIIDCKAGGR